MHIRNRLGVVESLKRLIKPVKAANRSDTVFGKEKAASHSDTVFGHSRSFPSDTL